MRRPTGFTLLALVLGQLAFSALANTGLMVVAVATGGNYGNVPLALGAAAYAVTAGVATVGLWRVAPWALRAYLAWGAAVLAFMGLFVLAPPPLMQESREQGWPHPLQFAAFFLFIIVLLWLPVPYIRRRLGTLLPRS
ncbi:MAG TPA: hypothetical protein VGB15_05860 [Longimicrobium sp.]|jgi:hypothetical protein